VKREFKGERIMTQDDIQNLMFKGAGLVFIVLAILAIPNLVAGIISLGLIGFVDTDATPSLVRFTVLSQYMLRGGIAALLKFIICVGGARYFLYDPRMVKNWMNRKRDTEQPGA
jgi:hypothetical protein